MVESVGWGNEWDITQMVKLTFTRLRLTGNYKVYDGIFMQLANSGEETFLSLNSMIFGVTSYDTLHRQRSFIGKREIINRKDFESLEGKTVFVSLLMHGSGRDDKIGAAYFMHRLWGKISRDAKIIREAMIEAKIIALQRILDYPHSQFHLSCDKGFFDYESRILQAMELIRHFPDHPIPQD